MSAFGYYMPWYTVGGALVLIGGALFYSTVDMTTPVANIYGYSAITGLGGGMYLQTGFSIAQASVARTRVADASSFITCSQVVGSTIALAITNSAFLNEAQDNVVRLLPDIGTREVQTVISGASELIKGLTEDLKREVEEGIVSAMGIRISCYHSGCSDVSGEFVDEEGEVVQEMILTMQLVVERGTATAARNWREAEMLAKGYFG